jgi:hypothetical protein
VGVKLVVYMDDILLMGQDKKKLEEDTIKVVKILKELGWRIAEKKC